MMLTEEQKKQLSEAVELLNRADALMQSAMGADDECYYIHSAIQHAADDIEDWMQENG